MVAIQEQLDSLLEESQGEVTDEIAEVLEEQVCELESFCDLMVELKVSSDSDKAAAKSMRDRAKRITARAYKADRMRALMTERLRDYLVHNEIESMRVGEYNPRIIQERGRVPVEITGEVPEEYCRIEKSPDKDLIRSLLENSVVEVPWAKLGERGVTAVID